MSGRRVLTFGFVIVILGIVGGISWIRYTSTNQYFYRHNTQLTVPEDATQINFFTNQDDSIFGDGDSELSFYASTSDISTILKSKPFGQNWQKGALPSEKVCPYLYTESNPNFSCSNLINLFSGPNGWLQLKNNGDLMHVLIDRTPAESQVKLSDYTEIIVDPINHWVLVHVSDS